MVRTYLDRPVDAGAIDRMLRNAVRGPSAGFTQGFRFLVLDAPADVDRFWEATTTPEGRRGSRWLRGMRTAPVVAIPFSSQGDYVRRYAEEDKGWDDDGRWLVPYWHIDAGMASLLILLTAVDEGLGACFFGVPPGRVDALRQAFGVPEEYTPIGAITIGHPAPVERVPGSPARRSRRPIEELVHRGRWMETADAEDRRHRA